MAKIFIVGILVCLILGTVEMKDGKSANAFWYWAAAGLFFAVFWFLGGIKPYLISRKAKRMSRSLFKDKKHITIEEAAEALGTSAVIIQQQEFSMLSTRAKPLFATESSDSFTFAGKKTLTRNEFLSLAEHWLGD